MARTSREIKRRIASISSTQQITRAMEMVAAAKLRKVQDRVASTRPYYERLAGSWRWYSRRWRVRRGAPGNCTAQNR